MSARYGFLVHLGVAASMGLIAYLGAAQASGQTAAAAGNQQMTMKTSGWEAPVMDNRIFTHVLLDQLEGRSGASESQFRWDGEGWAGTDRNRIRVKSEGFVNHGAVSDGNQEALYDRPIPRLRYFDAQAGVREDLDSGPRRTWGAVGIEGLAPHFFEFAPTLYFREGNVAGRLEGSYDLLLTQRLVLQPEAELNFYSTSDPGRGTGSGLSDLDTGVRLRYAISRRFAPYVGFAYAGKYGGTASYARQAGEAVASPTFVFGIRVWR